MNSELATEIEKPERLSGQLRIPFEPKKGAYSGEILGMENTLGIKFDENLRAMYEFSNGSARRDWFVVKSDQLVICSFKAVQTGRELVEMFLAMHERGLVRTEQRQVGMYYSILRIIGKSSKLLEPLTLFLLGAFFGYVSGENPGQNPKNAFHFLIGIFLLVSILLAGLISQKFSFESKQNK